MNCTPRPFLLIFALAGIGDALLAHGTTLPERAARSPVSGGASAVSWVHYSGLPEDPSYALARRYLPRGAGSIFTFGVKGGYEAGKAVINNVRLFSHLAHVGDARSLIIHPASTTHQQLSVEDQLAGGATPDLTRLSMGIENSEDSLRDLDQALRVTAYR